MTDGVARERGRSQPGFSVMSDQRLSGEVLLEEDADRFMGGSDLLWGTNDITNNGGSWSGTSVGATNTSGGGGNITPCASG